LLEAQILGPTMGS